MRVDVYFNLHKRVFSVRALEGPNKGRVVYHSHNVWLRNASFVVHKAGRERVLREKRKNVHAFVRGTFITSGEPLNAKPGARQVTYRPYQADHFFEVATGARVDRADVVGLTIVGKPMILAYETER